MYPIADANLAVMRAFATLDFMIGYSDHTLGTKALEVVAAMDAEVLEFHFTDQKQDRIFRDHQLSLGGLDPRNLTHVLENIRNFQGTEDKYPLPIKIMDDHLLFFRRTIYTARDIEAGEVVNTDNICILRPNQGIDARDFDRVVGRLSRRRLQRHEPPHLARHQVTAPLLGSIRFLPSAISACS